MAHDHLGAEEWDERHRARGDGVWSGHPHPALVHLADELEPGRCLEVGCGEGADAIWLAEQGWDVTALDLSGVVLDRARAKAAERGVEVHWVQADAAENLPDGSFDLVFTIYPAIPSTEGFGERFVASVGPGGRFLGAWHGPDHTADAVARGFDPTDYVQPDDVLPHLVGWALMVDELRPNGDGEDRLVLGRRKPE